MSYEIQLENLKKIYPDGTVALGGVFLKCPRGKTTALVGPSGSGKSTILKIVAGLMEATDGVVLFEGRDVTHLPPEKRNIGMVFQSYALFPNMTVEENVEFGLLVRGMRRTERRSLVKQALESVQIVELALRRIHQLSGGQQQRVALARVVVFKPDILLLDEPLSALDAEIRVELRGELAHLLEQFNITAVYVTHDQQEAMSLGDQVVVLDKGLIKQVGSPYEVYARPANCFVANFIGSANLYDADIISSTNGVRMVRLGFGEIVIPEKNFRERWCGLQCGQVKILCRPENVRIADPENAHARLKVKERLFLGDRLRISGTTEDGNHITLEVHNSINVREGDILQICFDIDNLHFLSAET
jgi:putative spermidine/putrescine transport system ATP-binding protein